MPAQIPQLFPVHGSTSFPSKRISRCGLLKHIEAADHSGFTGARKSYQNIIFLLSTSKETLSTATVAPVFSVSHPWPSPLSSISPAALPVWTVELCKLFHAKYYVLFSVCLVRSSALSPSFFTCLVNLSITIRYNNNSDARRKPSAAFKPVYAETNSAPSPVAPIIEQVTTIEIAIIIVWFTPAIIVGIAWGICTLSRA